MYNNRMLDSYLHCVSFQSQSTWPPKENIYTIPCTSADLRFNFLLEGMLEIILKRRPARQTRPAK